MLYGNDKQRAVPWLCATTGKYLGAIETARGNVDEARRHFCTADAAFGGKFDSYFLSVIGLTVRAEAFRSLKDEAWLLSARQLLASIPDDARKYVAFSRWRDYIDNPTDEKFPALSYWY